MKKGKNNLGSLWAKKERECSLATPDTSTVLPGCRYSNWKVKALTMESSILRESLVKLETCTVHGDGKEQSTIRVNTISLPKSTGLKPLKTSLLMSLHSVKTLSFSKRLLTQLIKLKSWRNMLKTCIRNLKNVLKMAMNMNHNLSKADKNTMISNFQDQKMILMTRRLSTLSMIRKTSTTSELSLTKLTKFGLRLIIYLRCLEPKSYILPTEKNTKLGFSLTQWSM